jgi:hypothetical protein
MGRRLRRRQLDPLDAQWLVSNDTSHKAVCGGVEEGP